MILWNAENCFRAWNFHECEFTDPSLIKILESFEIQVTKFHSNWNLSLLELVKCNFLALKLDENSIWTILQVIKSAKLTIWSLKLAKNENPHPSNHYFSSGTKNIFAKFYNCLSSLQKSYQICKNLQGKQEVNLKYRISYQY